MKSILSENCLVLENSNLAPYFYLLSLGSSRISELVEPGQFVSVLVGDRPDLILRRPLSVLDSIPGENIKLLVRVVGPGSLSISQSTVGRSIQLIGPLGNPFRISDHLNEKVLIAGGIGIVPVFFLLKKMCALRQKPILFYGTRSTDTLVLRDEIDELGLQVKYCTEDGSSGYGGLVTDCVYQSLNDMGNYICGKSAIYACGPRDMIKDIVNRFGRGKNIQICLEEMIACGVGACHSCVVRDGKSSDREGYRLVCKDGPVFFADEVDIG